MNTIKRILVSVGIAIAGMLVYAGIASADEINIPGLGFTIQAPAEIANPVNTFVGQLPAEQKQVVSDLASQIPTQIPTIPINIEAPVQDITPDAPAPALLPPNLDKGITAGLTKSLPNMVEETLQPVLDTAIKVGISPEAYAPPVTPTDPNEPLSVQLQQVQNLFVSRRVHADPSYCSKIISLESQVACSLAIIDENSGNGPAPAVTLIAPFSFKLDNTNGGKCGYYVLSNNYCNDGIHVSPAILTAMAQGVGYDQPTLAQTTGVIAHEREHAMQDQRMAENGQSMSAFVKASHDNTFSLEQGADTGAGVTIGNAQSNGVFTQDDIDSFVALIRSTSPDHHEVTHGSKDERQGAIEDGIGVSRLMQQAQLTTN